MDEGTGVDILVDDNIPPLGGTLRTDKGQGNAPPPDVLPRELYCHREIQKLGGAPNLKLQLWPADVLAQPCEEVTDFDESLGQLIDGMAKVMYSHGGAGIAAPQVGRLVRVCIVDVEQKRRVLVNPKVTWLSQTTITESEGCLSMPGLFKQIERPAALHVTAQSRFGGVFEIKATGRLARALQHEIEHLDGIVFLDLLPSLSRNRALKKWAKIQKQIGRRGKIGGAPRGPRKRKQK